MVGAIHESPEIKLKPYGEIVSEIIANVPDKLNVVVDKYVIMPDHIHLILVITRDNAERAIRESPLRQRSIISNVVGYIKMNASKSIRLKNNCSDPIWQRSYYEHIIRDKDDYAEIVKYIQENPLKRLYEQQK